MDWRLERRIHQLREPLLAAHGTIRSREVVLVAVEHEGHTGWGEAAPLPSYDGGDIARCEAQLREHFDRLSVCDPDDPDAALRSLDGEIDPQARAAIEVALRDLHSRLAGLPLWRSLGAREAPPLPVSALITATDPQEAGAQALVAVGAGHATLKVKVGLPDDRPLLRGIRSAIGDGPRLRLDANCAWDDEVALARLDDLAEFKPELCEQPIRGIDGLRELAGLSPIPLALDEDATAEGALAGPAVARAVCLKLQAWGGIDRLVEAARAARSAGMLTYLGSSLDGPISIAAAGHAAAVIGPELDSGLATLDQLVLPEADPLVDNGFLSLGDHPGLGIDPDGRAT